MTNEHRCVILVLALALCAAGWSCGETRRSDEAAQPCPATPAVAEPQPHAPTESAPPEPARNITADITSEKDSEGRPAFTSIDKALDELASIERDLESILETIRSDYDSGAISRPVAREKVDKALKYAEEKKFKERFTALSQGIKNSDWSECDLIDLYYDMYGIRDWLMFTGYKTIISYVMIELKRMRRPDDPEFPTMLERRKISDEASEWQPRLTGIQGIVYCLEGILKNIDDASIDALISVDTNADPLPRHLARCMDMAATARQLSFAYAEYLSHDPCRKVEQSSLDLYYLACELTDAVSDSEREKILPQFQSALLQLRTRTTEALEKTRQSLAELDEIRLIVLAAQSRSLLSTFYLNIEPYGPIKIKNLKEIISGNEPNQYLDGMSMTDLKQILACCADALPEPYERYIGAIDDYHAMLNNVETMLMDPKFDWSDFHARICEADVPLLSYEPEALSEAEARRIGLDKYCAALEALCERLLTIINYIETSDQ